MTENEKVENVVLGSGELGKYMAGSSRGRAAGPSLLSAPCHYDGRDNRHAPGSRIR